MKFIDPKDFAELVIAAWSGMEDTDEARHYDEIDFNNELEVKSLVERDLVKNYICFNEQFQSGVRYGLFILGQMSSSEIEAIFESNLIAFDVSDYELLAKWIIEAFRDAGVELASR